MTQKIQDSPVDANEVIQQLAARIADLSVQNAILTTRLANALASANSPQGEA